MFVRYFDHHFLTGLAQYLYTLLRNTRQFNSFFSWRPYYNIHSFTSVPDNCMLCDLLNNGDLMKYKVYQDMFKWLVRDAKCIYTR